MLFIYLFEIKVTCTGDASDLQAGEERKQGVHPGACGQQGFVDVDVQQQRRLTDILHYRCIVLKDTEQVKLHITKTQGNRLRIAFYIREGLVQRGFRTGGTS